DLYNLALTEALKNPKEVELRGGTFHSQFGTFEVQFDPASARWGDHELTNLTPIAELKVEGFPSYYRRPGIGAPLAAGVKPNEKDADLLARRVRVPVTVLLRMSNVRAQLHDGYVRTALEVYPGFGRHTVTINGREVPLEAEPTAAMGLMLAETNVWQF